MVKGLNVLVFSSRLTDLNPMTVEVVQSRGPDPLLAVIFITETDCFQLRSFSLFWLRFNNISTGDSVLPIH